MAQVPKSKGRLRACMFRAGFGGVRLPLFWGSRFVPLFDWLSAVRLVFLWEPNPLSLAWIGPFSVFLASLTVHALRSFGGGRC